MDKAQLVIEIDRALGDWLSSHDLLTEASRYAVVPGGKRIRPLLVLSIAFDLNGGNSAPFVGPACAVELLHCSSLVHDDLPALDNDDYRRGRPTVHRAYSEAQAVLAGDLLISEAFRIVLSNKDLNDEQKIRIQSAIASGFSRVCKGQSLDLLPRTSVQEVLIVHREKTGALFGACFEIGAILSGLDKHSAEELSALGEDFGILFQLVDDLLDRHGDPATRGRENGSDERNSKFTFFSGQPTEEAAQEALQRLQKFEDRLAVFEATKGRVLHQTRELMNPILAPLRRVF